MNKPADDFHIATMTLPLRFIIIMLLLAAMVAGQSPLQLVNIARAASTKTGVPGAYSICVRPGGTSRPWVFGNDTTPDPSYPGIYPITQISYHNVGAPINWTLTRGHFEYSTNGGSTWLPYTVSSNPNFVSVSGTKWHFIDTQPGDTTHPNNVGVAWFLQGVPNNVGSGTSIIPDNPPTDISSDTYNIIINTATGTRVATLTPTDTGCTQDGYWVLEGQSVPNLFTLSFDSTTGNTASLSLGTGTLPAAGQSATVTVRYYDLYQTDSSDVPISGQGISKQLTYNFVDDATKDLNFSNDLAVSTVAPVYSGYARPSAATLSSGNYVTVWTEFGHGNDAKAINGTSNDYGGIYGRQYTSAGTASGAAFAVTPEGDGIDTYEPAVAALNAGRTVVAYRTSTSSNGYDIGYRIIEANGTIGSELTANTTLTGDQTSPAVATLTDGSFMITWLSAGSIYAQKLNAADGSKNGSELAIHSNTSDVNPAIAALSNGDYTIAWGDSSTGNVSAIVSSALSTVIPVTSDGSSWGYYFGSRPSVAGLTGGGFVVAWDSYGTIQSDIFFQRYSNAGVAQGAGIKANTDPVGNKNDPSLAALTGGGFVIAWQSDNGDYDLHGIFGRRFSSAGAALDTGDFAINQYRKGDQIEPNVTPLGADLFAAAWEADASQVYQSTPGIYTRVLLPSGPSTCTGIGSGTVNWTVAFAACPPGAKLVIPPGLNVILDTDIALDRDLEVQGTLDAVSMQKTLTLTGSGDQTLTGNPLTFYRLTVNKTNASDTVTISGKLKVTKKLTITKGKLKSASDYLDVQIDPAGTLELTSDISVGGDWTNNGTFTHGGHAVTFDGSSLQTIGGTNLTAFDSMTVAAGAKVFLASLPTAATSLVNNGVISQTATVGTSSSFNFLQISTDKYRGVDISTDASNDLGSVSVAISGNASSCSADIASPTYRKRCFRVTAQYPGSASMTFYTTVPEDIVTGSEALYQYQNYLPIWADMSANCGANPGDSCSTNTPIDLKDPDISRNGSDYFLIGDFNNSPTAVTIESITARAQPLVPGMLILGLLLLTLALGLLNRERNRPATD